jgi:alkylation response protein AidB-like acyl-CoA dehydrogenase
MTAQHVSEREQFGRPLSTNQGVALQAADAHIDIDGIRVTQLQAAWQLDEGLECSKAVSSAKWWASEAGQRVVVTTQHLHGGTGADTSHPIHRYFLWVIQLADTLSGAGKSLNTLGKLIAEEALNKTI